MIFQDPLTSFNPVYSVGYQIGEAVLAHNDVSKAAARERAIELLELVGIPNPKQRIDNCPTSSPAACVNAWSSRSPWRTTPT